MSSGRGIFSPLHHKESPVESIRSTTDPSESTKSVREKHWLFKPVKIPEPPKIKID